MEGWNAWTDLNVGFSNGGFRSVFKKKVLLTDQIG
jgi:hypothetical protein